MFCVAAAYIYIPAGSAGLETKCSAEALPDAACLVFFCMSVLLATKWPFSSVRLCERNQMLGIFVLVLLGGQRLNSAAAGSMRTLSCSNILQDSRSRGNTDRASFYSKGPPPRSSSSLHTIIRLRGGGGDGSALNSTDGQVPLSGMRPYSSRHQSLAYQDVALSEVAAEIKAVEAKIEEVEAEIKKLSNRIDECEDAEEKKQLREEKNKLRDEKNIILVEKYRQAEQHRGSVSATAGDASDGEIDLTCDKYLKSDLQTAHFETHTTKPMQYHHHTDFSLAVELVAVMRGQVLVLP